MCARVGGPSPSHEWRRATLHTLAVLAGYKLPLALPDGGRPDVCLFAPDVGALFIGDAKHSEDSSNSFALHRLAGYMAWLRRDRPSPASDLFAICHAVGQVSGWGEALVRIADDAGVRFDSPRYSTISQLTAVTWLRCHGSRLTPPPRDIARPARRRCIAAPSPGIPPARVPRR